MSKTSQRKRSLFDQGFLDGKAGAGYRWVRHPHLDEYKRGWRDGRKELLKEIKQEEGLE